MGADINIVESQLQADSAIFREVVAPGRGWSKRLTKGQVLRIVDLEGNQAVDALFYDADDPSNRYSATDTVREQGNIYLTTGTELVSLDGDVLLTIVADTCGRHDTLGGACAAESNQVRYAISKKSMHNCRDNYLLEIADNLPGMTKRDITSNINFFMNVPVTPEGGLKFDDGISAPGRYVEMRVERDLIMLVSICPQLNNPCNAYNPTPVEFLVW